MKITIELDMQEVQVLFRALTQREQFLMSLWGEQQLTRTSKERSSQEISKVLGVSKKLSEALHK